MTEEKPEAEVSGELPRVSLRWWQWTLLVLFVAFLLLISKAWPAAILLIIHSVAGWAFHLERLSHSVTWSPVILILSVTFLAFGAKLLLGIVRWMSAARGKEAPPSKAVLKILTMFLCACAAAIATSGVMHEAAWLASKPCIEHTGHSDARTEGVNNMKITLHALFDYAKVHQRYPDRLEELTLDNQKLARHLFYRTSLDPDSLQPIIYLKPQGLPDDSSPGSVLLIAAGYPAEKLLAGRSDGGVAILPRRSFEKEHPEFHWPEEEP